MKKAIIIYGVIILVVVVIAVLKLGNVLSAGEGNDTSASATIHEKTYNVVVADDEKERMVGLSETESLGDDEGMLFVFEKKGIYPFWMKGMEFPIDIIFINDKSVVEVVKNAQPPTNETDSDLTVYEPKENINFVLELKAGQADEKGIKTGDTIEFSNLSN